MGSDNSKRKIVQKKDPIINKGKKGIKEMKEREKPYLLLPKNIKNIKKIEVFFNDKEDSADENEESTEDQDEMNQNDEVSPKISNIKPEDFIEDLFDKNEENELPDEVDEIDIVSPNLNNIEKEELKDRMDSVDKNEESIDSPDEVIEIDEASPIISDFKKEDFKEDLIDKNEESPEDQDEVNEIDGVSPYMDCIEKEELKDQKDSIDENEENIGSSDEVDEIVELSPNILYIEKEKSIEDLADKEEEIEQIDEVGEIDVVSPNMNYIEKEELKDKIDLVDKNDKSIEKPDELGENIGVSPPIDEKNKNDNVLIQVQEQPIHIILKKFILPHRKLNPKTKQLLLFSIYQKKMLESKSRKEFIENENIILINKDFLEKYFFNEILDLVNEDNELKDEINNIDINNFSISSIKNIIIILDNDKINAINDKISNVNEDEANLLLSPKEEEVQLIGKNLKIYNDFVVIDRQIFDNFIQVFKINLEDQNASYISFKRDFILKIKNNEQTSLILGHFHEENCSNNISYILDFDKQEELNNQLPLVHSYGVDYYVSDKLMFEKGIKDDYISPIFNFENMIGYGYKYEPVINDYRKHDNYIRFLNCENLNNIITLFSYDMLFKEKKKSKLLQNGKYYFVNQDYLNYLKKKLNYNLLSSTISPYEPENIKNLYTFIKKIPNSKLDKFWNYKMEEVLFDENSDSYYTIEPDSIVAEYKKEKVLIYDNFLLIDEKSGKALSDNKENSHFYGECTFIDNKIIINQPNYLNSSGLFLKIISLIGNLYTDNCFKIEYILIYASEFARTNHLNSIKDNLVENLRNLKFKNNICSFNFQSSEVIIIKYRKKDNFKLETYFKQRPKIGLDNIGATCYMNSTLQCLTHIDSLVDYFKYDPQIEEIKQNKETLASSFKSLIDNLYPDKNYLSISRYAPNDFKEKISIMNTLFKGNNANDAKDLVNFIIMTLHKELNKKDEIPDLNKDLPQNPDQSNKELIYLCFENEILRESKSIISDLFYGVNRGETQCCNCYQKIYNYQTFFFLNFPLEVVRQYRNQKMSQMNFNMMYPMNQNNSNEVDIMDCFENEEKANVLTGMYCNGCKQNVNSNMKTVLVTGPEELILILNRGKGKQFDIKLNFTENLNLYRFIEKKETGYKYILTGVITHIGESSQSGHFIAFCLDQIEKKWYKYNDSFIYEVVDFGKEVINNSSIMPYLLFYHKLNK